MNIAQVYAIMGWPLRFWRTKTLPPQPIANDLLFDEAIRIASGLAKPAVNPTTDDEFREKCLAMDIRYESLRQGERLGKLTQEERRELSCMETGSGWCLDLTHPPRRERLGRRQAFFL